MTQKKSQQSPQVPPDPSITDAINGRLTEGRLSCADAFVVAKQVNVEPLVIGEAVDALAVRLSHCQLGLFGYPGKQGWQGSGVIELEVPDGLEAAIVEACNPEGMLACVAAWHLASRFGVARLQLGWLAEKLGIRIAACQLGAF